MALQNGSARHLFWSTNILTILSKMINQCIHDLIKHIKIPEPFCRASILARPQRQLSFSQCHFVGFLPSSPPSLILFGGGSNFFHVIFAAWFFFVFFANNVLAILLQIETSTEWVAVFSLSMTNSDFFTLKNIYKMAFCLLQNGLFWCP